MSFEEITWRNLKSVYLIIKPIKELVDSWFDVRSGISKEAFITSFEQRYFLRRLVVRAFKEMLYAHQVREVVLAYSSRTSGWAGKTTQCDDAWLLEPYRITWGDGTTTDIVLIDEDSEPLAPSDSL